MFPQKSSNIPQWLAGIGKTMADVERDIGGGAMPYIIGFLAA